ncbi:hypothetical protein FGO68_gene6155 [Halteria grandinella]|uniref:Uncharacterized protein n=1 Tax=Halteria grandinella TaxID=5974 RepID=A0A8J8NJL9_HALGN|nr:hypothetical protein FGO68_gene6155 [Halteria grandinella]
MTFGMLGLAISFLVFVGLISAIVIIALIPHFVLAIFAYNKVKKPIREQLMGDNSISCSMVTLIIMTLMPFIALLWTVWLQRHANKCHGDSCGLEYAVLIFLGYIPTILWGLLWFLPFSYFQYKKKLEAAQRDKTVMDRIKSPQYAPQYLV